MTIKTSSPGVYIREIDLTRGAADAITTNIGFLAGPFQKGVVGELRLISTEVELIQEFGEPTDDNYEYWWSVNNFLEYSGSCYVMRVNTDSDDVTQGGVVPPMTSTVTRSDGSETVVSRVPRMRNSRDIDPNTIAQNSSIRSIDQVTSDIYLKSDAQFRALDQRVEDQYKSVFFGRQTGSWTNSVGVAVIDKGADYQFTIAQNRTPLSTDMLTIIDGGVSGSAGADEGKIDGPLDGGTAKEINTIAMEQTMIPFNRSLNVGQSMARYAKVLLDGCRFLTTDVSAVSLSYSGSTAVDFDNGVGFFPDVNKMNTKTGVKTVAETGIGENLLVDLELDEEGSIVSVTPSSITGASGPVGYEVGDRFKIINPDDALGDAIGYITEVFGPKGQVVKIGTSIGVVVDVIDNTKEPSGGGGNGGNGGNNNGGGQGYDGYDGYDGDGGGSGDDHACDEGETIVATIAFAPLTDGTFGSAFPPELSTQQPAAGLPIVDIQSGGVQIGVVGELWSLGEFLYYGDSGLGTLTTNRLLDVVWKPTVWSRNNGIEFLWPARPFAGETVFWEPYKKIAVDIYGQKRTDENGQPIPVQGPAKIYDVARTRTDGSNTGTYARWDDFVDGWVTEFNATAGLVIFDNEVDSVNPTEIVSYSVSKVDDWYEQQIAFAGIPWTSFAARPGTSRHALESGAIDDEMHVIVYNVANNYKRVGRGSTFEQYLQVSKLKGAKTEEGSNNYYADLINENSEFIYSNYPVHVFGQNSIDEDGVVTTGINQGREIPGSLVGNGVKAAYLKPRYGTVDVTNEMKERAGRSADTSQNQIQNRSYVLLGGSDEVVTNVGDIQQAYNALRQENMPDVDYIIQGPAFDHISVLPDGVDTDDIVVSDAEKFELSVAKASFLISLAEDLKKGVALISPPRHIALEPINAGQITEGIVQFAKALPSSSYAIMDSGYKFMVDRFRNKKMYVPLNGDIAGTMARTSLFSEPFFSPAGMSRGQIKNVIKLGYDPSKAQRDILFSNRVNPVVTFPGEGTVLYGDKTMLAYKSAFDRINVRKLFIYLEREIGKIAKNVLFEFNDVTTRTNFKNNVIPFLRDVQSKRGMIDFLVVCDDSNNTPEVIDRNEFIADFYIKPNRSINFVQLNFVATKTGVSFSEAVGLFRRVEGLQ